VAKSSHQGGVNDNYKTSLQTASNFMTPMNLIVDEDQLTTIIKAAFEHYKDKPFGRASFTAKPNGIEVQFHDARCDCDDESSNQEPVDPLAPAKEMLTTWALMGLAGGCGTTPDFGGGQSGGAGATGGW
jgi:hypothetical protein